MATIIQKIFLSKKKIVEQEQKKEVKELLQYGKISHYTYTTKNGCIISRFSAVLNKRNINADHIFDKSHPTENQVSYKLLVSEKKHPVWATNSHIDKFAEKVYLKMLDMHNKAKKHAR